MRRERDEVIVAGIKAASERDDRDNQDDYRQRCDTYRVDLVLATTREAALRVGLWAATGLPRNYTDKSHIDEAWRIQRTRQQATCDDGKGVGA